MTLLKLTEFSVEGYGTFANKTTFDMSHKGISTIFGWNRDAGGKRYTNGAGKSLLASAIPEGAFGAPPSGKDKNKPTKQTLTYTFKSGDDTVEFVKAYGKGKKFTVTKNGKDLSVRTLDYASKKLQALLGGSEEDFYTTRYIDNTIPHPLIVGKAAVRQDFFVRLFNLGDVDAIRHLLLAELREVQKVAATYKEVRDLFDDLKGKSLSATVLAEKEDRLRGLKRKQKDFLEHVNKYQVVRDLVRFEKHNAELVASFDKHTTVETFVSDRTDLQTKARRLRRDLEEAKVWDTYDRLYVAYTDELLPLQEKIHGLVGEGYDKVDVRAKADEYESYLRELDKVVHLLDKGGVSKPVKVSDPGIDEDKVSRKVLRLKDELENARTYKDGKCPTCGADHQGRPLKVIKAELADFQGKLADHQAYSIYAEQRKTYLKHTENLAKNTLDKQRLEKKVDKLKSYFKAARLVEKLPSKPRKPEGERLSLYKVEEAQQALQKKTNRFDRFADIFEQLVQARDLTADQRKHARDLDSFTDKLSSINDKVSNLSAEVTAATEAHKQLKGLATRGKVLRRQAQDEPILKTLIDGYSKKGLKKLMIQQRCALLQQQVNKFVRMFFSEDILFEFKYESQLDFLAHRKKGKKTITTDVKRLSGAEKRMLTLVLVAATISLTPKNKRSNFLILDEPDANMSPEATAVLTRNLPILNKVVDHIIVISPNPDLHIEGSRNFTVVKRNGVSTLKEGRVK